MNEDIKRLVDGVRLTRAQRRLLRDLANGGWLYAALRRSSDFMADGVLFSESVGIMVGRPGATAGRYRVRNKTVAPLYLATPPLITDDGTGGLRDYYITDAGRQALASLTTKETEHG